MNILLSKITIDARMINNSGIGVYIRNYTEYILKNNEFSEIVLLGNKKELVKYFSKYSNWICKEITAPIYSIKEQLILPFLIPQCDIFWSPHYNIPLLPIKAKKRVVTLPDTAHLALSDSFGFSLIKKLYAQIVFKAATRISNTITTISKFSKNEIVKYTHTKPSKISTIYLGIDNSLFKPLNKSELTKTLEKYKLPQKFILFVGNIKPHKNLSALLDGFLLAESQLKGYNLVILGKKEGFITGDGKIFEQINNNEILKERVNFTGYVAEEDLPQIYNLASIFAFPSIYEGFGFPPLEAMACGCPVVCSDSASLPEVCGDAAFYVNATNPAEISSGLIEVLSNDKLKDNLIEKGFVKVNQYNWDKSSIQFIDCLKNK